MTASLIKVTSKGQVTLPKEVRKALGIEEKDQLLVIVENDRAVLIPLRKRSVHELRGSLPATRPYPGMDAMREEVRREMGERMVKGEE